MSRAFVKDGEQEFEDMPDRLISEHPNLVTPEGLAQIEAEVERLNVEFATAQTARDRTAIAVAARELRYWKARQLSAEVVTPPQDSAHIHFGSIVTIERGDGRRQTFRIVGEDEANPLKGTIPYVAPLARALVSKGVGDVVRVGDDQVEVLTVA